MNRSLRQQNLSNNYLQNLKLCNTSTKNLKKSMIVKSFDEINKFEINNYVFMMIGVHCDEICAGSETGS